MQGFWVIHKIGREGFVRFQNIQILLYHIGMHIRMHGPLHTILLYRYGMHNTAHLVRILALSNRIEKKYNSRSTLKTKKGLKIVLFLPKELKSEQSPTLMVSLLL